MKRWMMAIALLGWLAQAGTAQDAKSLGYTLPDFEELSAASQCAFGWSAGQVLTYHTQHETRAAEVTAEGKVETSTKLTLTKRWKVVSGQKSGEAQLELSLVALRMETTTPSGETLLFDSAAPEKSDPRLREQLSKLVGVTLATLRLDDRGKVVAVTESKFGPASRFEAEPPFVLVLSSGITGKPGESWKRAYQITQEPPLGGGEKYDAEQTYTCTKSDENGVHFTLTTALKTQPKSLADRVPLLQVQPEGTVVFDKKNNRLHSAKLTVKKELKGHAGEGSSYTFESTYTEEIVP